MDRRKFIKYGSGGLVGLALGGGRGLLPAGQAIGAQAVAIDLAISQTKLRLLPDSSVDNTEVFMWAFRDKAGSGGPRVPGPVIRVRAGDELIITIENMLDEPHRFTIGGYASTDDIAPGAAATLQISAPAPGTYLYYDSLNDPAGRLLGLHGALVVLPQAAATSHNLTPYALPPTPMQHLFDDLSSDTSMFATLGRDGMIAGGPWNPEQHGKDLVWIFGQIDTRWNARAEAGQTFSGADLRADFVPRYFTMNGKPGYYSAVDPDTAPHGAVGEPCLIRCIQAGLGCQAPHIHGNHIFELTRRLAGDAVVPSDNLFERDTWLMDELRIEDVLLPYRKPPDIWPWPPVDLPTFERQLPLFYPMHCHNQPSNTAGGGSYPQGTITHWGINGFPGITKVVSGH